MSAPAIDHSSAASIVKAANLAREKLTARLEAEPDSPIAEDLRTLIDAAERIAADYERRTT
jgi:hypothetical protein